MTISKLLKFSLVLLFLNQLGCAEVAKLKEPKPLVGADVSVHPLAKGQVDLRMKVSGLTSTLWITTELVNHSSENLNYSAKDLLVFENPDCIKDYDFENAKNGTLTTNARVLLRYSFQTLAKQKNSPEYQRCRELPLRVQISGMTLGNAVVEPLRLTLDATDTNPAPPPTDNQ